MELSPALALVDLMLLMKKEGCTHEQRREVADALSEIRLGQGVEVIPSMLYPIERKVLASTINTTYEIHYAPAAVPNFGGI